MKLYAVTIERTIMVLAEDEREAIHTAETHESDEAVNQPDYIHERECKRLSDIPAVWRNCIPYGGPDGPLRDLNCTQVFEKLQPSSANGEPR